MVVVLNTLDFINGLFSFLVMIISVIIGIAIVIKYFQFKNKTYLYWGIAYIGLYCPWWSSGISFLFVLITGESLSLLLYLFIGSIFIPFFLILWVLGFTEMKFKDKRKILILFFSIVLTIAEIYLIYGLITDCTLLGTKTGVFDIKFSRLWLIYLMWVNLSVTITGLIFAWGSIKTKDKLNRFRGIVLIIAFLTYPICGIIDGGIELNEIGLILIRSILIAGAVLFYIGFFVPKFVKKLSKLE